MTSQSKVLGIGGATNLGVYPAYIDKTSYVMTDDEKQSNFLGKSGNRVSGYLQDGDYFEFPDYTAPTTSPMTYHDNTGAVVWSLTPSQIGVGATNWSGFFLDDAREWFYLLAVQFTGAPGHTFHISRISATTWDQTALNFTVANATMPFEWTAYFSAGNALKPHANGTDASLICASDTEYLVVRFNFRTGTLIEEVGGAMPAGATIPSITCPTNDGICIAMGLDYEFSFLSDLSTESAGIYPTMLLAGQLNEDTAFSLGLARKQWYRDVYLAGDIWKAAPSGPNFFIPGVPRVITMDDATEGVRKYLKAYRQITL